MQAWDYHVYALHNAVKCASKRAICASESNEEKQLLSSGRCSRRNTRLTRRSPSSPENSKVTCSPLIHFGSLWCFEVFLAFHPILALNCLSQVPVSARSLYFTVFLVGVTSLSRDSAAPPFEIWAWEGFPDILSPIKNCFLSIYSPFRLLMCFLCGLF